MAGDIKHIPTPESILHVYVCVSEKERSREKREKGTEREIEEQLRKKEEKKTDV